MDQPAAAVPHAVRYLVVRALLVLVRAFGVLPDSASKAYARLLDSARGPFNLINYLGSCAGARIIPPRRT